MGKIGYGRRWIGCVVAFHSLVASGGWKLGRFWKGSFHGWLIIGVNWYVIVFCLDELLMELLSSFFFHSFQRNIGRIVKFRYYKRYFTFTGLLYRLFTIIIFMSCYNRVRFERSVLRETKKKETTIESALQRMWKYATIFHISINHSIDVPHSMNNR